VAVLLAATILENAEQRLRIARTSEVAVVILLIDWAPGVEYGDVAIK
jgi:hypothetical protein